MGVVVRLAIALCAVLLTSVAAAETKDDAAQALYEEAKTLVTKGDWAAACPKLLEAKRLSADMKITYRLAECYEHIGKLASAARNFREAAVAADRADEPAKSKAALERATALEAKVPKLRLQSQAPGSATLRIDDDPIAGPWVDVPLPIDPGTHTIAVDAVGKKPFRGSVTAPNEPMTVDFQVPSLDDASNQTAPAPATPTTPTPTSEVPPSAPGSRTLGLVIGSAGLAVTGLGAYLALSARAQYRAADAHCPPRGCDDYGYNETNEARTRANVATVVLGVGVAAIATGVILYVLPNKSGSTSIAVAPAGLILRGEF